MFILETECNLSCWLAFAVTLGTETYNFLFVFIFICGRTGSWTPTPWVRMRQCFHCANQTEWCIITLHIYFSYFFTTVLMEIIYLPQWDLNQDHVIGSRPWYPLCHRDWWYWIFGYIYCTLQTVVFARRNLATSQVQTPLSPLLLTQSRPQNCSAHLPRPWVWQISKSANCKLHLLTYLYMYRGRWLACAIYSCHWRPLFPLWCHIPAHAPGDL